MPRNNRRYWPYYVGELWDATIGGCSKSVSTIGHRVQDSRAENLARAEGEHRRWPINIGELGVPMVDVAAGGHSMGESVKGTRSHLLLLKKECGTAPYLARQLSVFC